MEIKKEKKDGKVVDWKHVTDEQYRAGK